jgi:drug/metabolite transporter (DMT)-like permease
MMTQWALVSVVVLATAGGDLLQATEMRKTSNASVAATARSFVQRPLLVASVVCLAVSFGAFLALLRIADLSFAVPATAVSFVLETALAQWFLKERVGARRWAACFLVALGVAMLAL